MTGPGFVAPPLRWSRYVLGNPKREKRVWTPNRISHARRAVARELETVPLFPELAKFKTVEERMALIDDNELGFRENMRAHRAGEWRKVRREMRQLNPLTKLGLLKLWSTSSCPDDPVYLLAMIRDSHVCSPWRQLRTRKMLCLIGQSKDPSVRADLVKKLPK